ncbi:hypothetical protein BDB01DRAFT_123165 [Pilobolus umbonatus]|nr:hypothetical protein BDB01DRAFT_123165 [Pilobolus umbonatus]
MANIIKGYPSSRHIEYHIDQYHPDCRQLVQNIISTVKQKGLDFHPLEDRILDADSHKVPSYATANYKRYTPTSVNHFTLTKNKEDLISDEDRWARFNSIVQEEERAEQAVDQTKRSSVDFSRKPSIDMTNNTRTFNQPVKEPMMRPALGRFPSDSNRPPPRAPSNLFIAKPKAKVGVKSIQRSTSNPRPSFSNNLPPGLQRNQKTQMLDFDAATQIEQQNANEKKRVNDEIKAKQDAKKAELLMKRKKAQEEKERKRRKVEETRSPSSTKSPSPSSPISASHLPSSPVSPHMKDFDAPMIVHPPMRASSERNATF